MAAPDKDLEKLDKDLDAGSVTSLSDGSAGSDDSPARSRVGSVAETERGQDVRTAAQLEPLKPPASARTSSQHRRSSAAQSERGSLPGASSHSLGRQNRNDDDDDDEPGGFVGTEPLSRLQTAASARSAASRAPEYEVVFDEGDAEEDSKDGGGSGGASDNPRSWPLPYRGWVIFCVSFSTWVVVLYSTSYTAAIPLLMAEFGVHSTTIATLGVTSYLMGLAVGSIVMAPLSELYGRRPLYICCMSVFTLLVIPTGVATSLWGIIVVRFFGAFFGAVMISLATGTIVDISNEEYRALCMSLFSIAPFNGPITGPVIGGFVSQFLGWRWNHWLALILAGLTVVLMVTVKETYAPVILQVKAAKRRKETDDDRWWSRYDERKMPKADLLKLNLSRPFVLAFTEPILWFFNTWISVIYGILYLCIIAYPIVFAQHRGWSVGMTGLSFLGQGVGTLVAIAAEPLCRRLINAHRRDPETGRPLPEAAASLMVIGAVLTPIGQLVFSWTSLPVSIHWAVPIAAGVPFGAGNTLCFIYGSNYIASAYGIYAASAMAGNAVIRSAFGATFPLFGPSMYAALSPQWAGTLLGLLEVVLIPIPVAFYRYGERIRARSPVIRRMREDSARNEGRRAGRGGERRAAGDPVVVAAPAPYAGGGDAEKAAGDAGGGPAGGAWTPERNPGGAII
ncbi:hypothetical protein RB599_008390 [Gaeumannomyces hyphopodioides]